MAKQIIKMKKKKNGAKGMAIKKKKK